MSGVFQNIDPPPLTARRVLAPPPLPPSVRVEDILAGWRGDGGVNIFNILKDARDSSVLYICDYFVVQTRVDLFSFESGVYEFVSWTKT
jgi:hypothetical protein